MKFIQLKDYDIVSKKLTVNMKCFEIAVELQVSITLKKINRKHEMFWNENSSKETNVTYQINRKHEMFWNRVKPYNKGRWKYINRKHEMFWNADTFPNNRLGKTY